MLSKRECKNIEPLLWGYAAARLPQPESERVQRHLNTCRNCREQLKAYGQTLEGVALLHAQPVPTSLSNWQDLQRRLDALDAAPPVPARLSPFASFRGAAAGIALGGVACLLLGIVTARKQAIVTAQETESAAITGDQNEANPFKTYPHFPKRLAAESSDAHPFGRYAKTAKRPGDAKTVPNAFGVQAEMPVTARNPGAFQRNRHYGIAARRKHSKHLRFAYLLARRGEQNASPVPSGQIVALSPEASALILREGALSEGAEREQPEYVLTTIVDSAPQPRDFVMDTMTVDAQNGGSGPYNPLSCTSCNTSDNANGKEIRGW